MRQGLTLQQQNLIGSSVKEVFWLFQIDQNNDGNVDYFWSNKSYIFNSQAYTFKILAKEGDTNYGFSPLVLEMGSPESGQIPPSKVTIKVSLPNSVIDGLYASDFEGASITIKLIIKADLRIPPAPEDEDEAESPADFQEAEIMSWRFKVLSSHCIDQIMTWECQDWFTLHLEGEYPNTPLVSDLFPADIMKSDNVVVPVVFGQPFFPVRCVFNNIDAAYIDGDTFTVVGDRTALFAAAQFCSASCGVDGVKRCWVDSNSFGGGVTTVNLTVASDTLTANLTSVQINAYLLGESGITYTIDRARTPAEQSGKTIFYNEDIYTGIQPIVYKFKQDTVTGSDSQSYGVVQLICNRAAGTGPNDSNGIWGLDGGEAYDMPIKVSRSDLAAVISPPDIAAYLFEAFGVTSSEIDAVSQAAAAAIYAARGFDLNIGLWYRQEREKIISKLFSISGMVPVYRDKVGFKVRTKVPQLEIEEWMIMPGTFSIRNVDYTKRSDSGYVQWQLDTEPCDQVNKSLVAAKSTTARKSDTTIECEWIPDSVKAQKAGKLALQRTLLRDKIVNFTAKGYFLTLEPGDMITINPANLGAEGVPYDVLITRMTIREGLLIEVECVKFSDALDDWDDLSASGIVVGEASTINAYTPISQGNRDENSSAGSPNDITKTVTISSQGGITVLNGGNILVEGGGDLYLNGSDTDPGLINFGGSSYSVQMDLDADGDRFAIIPSVNNAVACVIGDYDTWYSEKIFSTLKTYSVGTTAINAGPKGPGIPGNYAGVALDPVGSEYGDGLISLIAQDSAVGVKSGSLGFNAYNMFFNFYLKGLVKFACWKYDLAVDEYVDLPSFSLGMIKIVGVWDNGSPFAGDYVFGPVGGSSETLAYVGSISRSNAAGNINVYDTTSVIRVLNHSDTGHSATLIILLWYF